MTYHELRTQQELQAANAELRGVRDELWLANQPPEVRAAVQVKRAADARARRWLARGGIGLVLLWGVLRTVFGKGVGDGFASGAVWLAWHGMEWALMLGVVVWLWSAVAKGARGAARSARWLAGARPDHPEGS